MAKFSKKKLTDIIFYNHNALNKKSKMQKIKAVNKAFKKSTKLKNTITKKRFIEILGTRKKKGLKSVIQKRVQVKRGLK